MREIAAVIARGAYEPETAADSVLLDHDMRVRRRIVLTTASGEPIRLNQVSVVQLKDGDGLKLDDGRVIRVEAKPELLLEIHAADPAGLVRIAWHLGNRHLPTQLLDGRIRIRYDHVIAGMVEKLGGRSNPVHAPFDPEGGAYAEAGHDHGHEHHHHGHGHR